MKRIIGILSLCFVLAHANAQITTDTYTPAVSLTGSTLYTNDVEHMTVAQTILCGCSGVYYVPSIHLANTSFTIPNYTFQPGYTYTVQINAAASASGNLSNPSASNVYFGASIGAVTGSLVYSATCNTFPDYQSLVNEANVLSYQGVGWTGSGAVDLSNNFLTNLVGIGYWPNNGTATNSTALTFTVRAAATGLNIELYPVLGNQPTFVPVTNGINNPVTPPTNTTLSVNSVTITQTPIIIITPTVNYICSSQVYSNQYGFPVTWTVSPATGVLSLAANGSAGVTATKSGPGNAVLTATYNTGGVSSSASINISTQPVVTAISSTASSTCDGNDESWFVSATANAPGATGWLWTVANPAIASQFYISSPGSPSTWIDVSGGGGVNVTFKDACGVTSSVNGVTIYNSSCRSNAAAFHVSPNPANGSATITAVAPITAAAAGTAQTQAVSTGKVLQAKITDQTGVVKKLQSFGAGVTSAKISLVGIKPGVYFLSVYDGKTWTSQQLVVQ